jgi:hypothetical protein
MLRLPGLRHGSDAKERREFRRVGEDALSKRLRRAMTGDAVTAGNRLAIALVAFGLLWASGWRWWPLWFVSVWAFGTWAFYRAEARFRARLMRGPGR